MTGLDESLTQGRQRSLPLLQHVLGQRGGLLSQRQAHAPVRVAQQAQAPHIPCRALYTCGCGLPACQIMIHTAMLHTRTPALAVYLPGPSMQDWLRLT